MNMTSDIIRQNQIFGTNRKVKKEKSDFTVTVKKFPAAQDFYVARIIRLAFYGFVATIPFETVDLGIPIELTGISLGFLFLSLVFQVPLCLRKPPAAYWLYFLYLVIFAIPVYISTPLVYLDEAKWQLFVLFQLMVMSWVAFNIMKSERAARGALITLALSCAVLAVLQQMGISAKVSEGSQLERVSALGFHPNNIARILSLGLLSLAGMIYAVRKKVFKSQLWIWLVIGIIGLTIIETGSRGALLALAAGFLVFVLKDGAVSTKIRNAVIVFIVLISFIVMIFQSEMSSSRFESAVEEGKLARRETIYPTAWKMFREKPLFGWGAKTGEYELGARLAHIDEDSKNPHNLILFALISSGLVGALPLFLGIWLTILTAWKSRHGVRGVLPLSLLAMVLIANMSGLWLHNKLHWLVMAYVLSSPFALKQQKFIKQNYLSQS